MQVSMSQRGPMPHPALHPALLGQSMHSELNAFFPFDPYRLPRSGSYIQAVYREWSSVAIDDDEDEDEDEEQEDEGEEDDVDKGTGRSQIPAQRIIVNGVRKEGEEDDADRLGESFGGMSISPRLASAMSVSVS